MIVDSTRTRFIICAVSPCQHSLSPFELFVGPSLLRPWQIHALCHSSQDDFSRSEGGGGERGFYDRKIPLVKERSGREAEVV